MRGCCEPLAREGRSLRCPRGHAFDLARSGYVNLLQPQERRSRHPGDPREAALARRRLFAARVLDPLLAALLEETAALPLPPRPAVLDVGCGEGSILRALAGERGEVSVLRNLGEGKGEGSEPRGAAGRGDPGLVPRAATERSTEGGIEACGVDISTPAIELAARSFPAATWVVANADRSLPWAAGSFDLVLSVTARRNPPELQRVLAPGGRALVVVPGEDDLVELREAVLGRGVRRERLTGALAELAPLFAVERRRSVRHRAHLEAPILHDLLASTYRGAREAERRRAGVLEAREVTLSYDLAVLKPLPS